LKRLFIEATEFTGLKAGANEIALQFEKRLTSRGKTHSYGCFTFELNHSR